MTKNDNFYKILFAIELALLPMVIFANMFLPTWAMGLMIAGVFICKLWREIFKNREDKAQAIIGSVASILDFGVLLIYFALEGILTLPLVVVTVVLVALYNIFKVVYLNKKMPETIEAVDFCFMIFECLALVSLIFISKTIQVVNIAMWTLIMTSAVSVVYKVYYGFKYDGWFEKIKNLFRRR